jgi:hypothetical protein
MIYRTEGEHFNHTIKACVMVKVLTFRAVDHDFEFWSGQGQNKDYKSLCNG